MSYTGVIVGVVSFLLIGMFHPIVIKGEYHLGRKLCWIFLVFGVLAFVSSLFIANVAISSIIAVFSFTYYL